MSDTIPFPRHGIAGYYALADLPQDDIVGQTVGTGWGELDKILKIYPSQFVVCTGTAGSGKSTFLYNLIVNLCWKYGKKAWLYVPENEKSLFRKMQLLFNNHTDKFSRFAASHCFVQSSDYQHYGDEVRDINWILGHAFEAHKRDGVSLVLIDPWNELERAKQRDELLTDYIGNCLMRVKMFARQTNCTMFMVAHPTKAATGRDVTLWDCEGSMNWMNKCDNGLIVKREEGAKDCTVISQKVREQPWAGRPGHCIFLVEEDTGIFREQVGGGQAL